LVSFAAYVSVYLPAPVLIPLFLVFLDPKDVLNRELVIVRVFRSGRVNSEYEQPIFGVTVFHILDLHGLGLRVELDFDGHNASSKI